MGDMKGGVPLRIERIHVYGFGQIQDESWQFCDGLNVVYGQNEAGKSTLLAFVRGVLFGFESRRHPEQRYEPVDGGSFGGTVTVVDEQGRTYRIERVYRKKIAGDVTVFLPDGGQAGEAYLEQLLNRMDEKVFKNVFAFGLNDLQRLETLKDAEVNRFIYTAGTGDGYAIVRVQKMLEERSAKLFRQNSSRPIVNATLKRIRETRKTLMELKRESAQYETLALKLRQFEEAIVTEEQQHDVWRHEMVWQEKLLTHFDDYEKYITIVDRLVALPEIESFPEDGINRLNELEQVERERRARLTELQAKYDELHKQLTANHIDVDILEHKYMIEQLRNSLGSYRENGKRIDYCTLTIRQEKQRLADLLAKLGTDWSEEHIAQLDVSHVARETVRRLGEQLKDSNSVLSLSQQHYRVMKEQHDALERKIAEWQAEEPERPVTSNGTVKTLEQLQVEQDALDELIQIEQQIGLMTTRIDAIRDRLSDLNASIDDRPTAGMQKNGWVKWGMVLLAFIFPALFLLFEQPFAAVAWSVLAVIAYHTFVGQAKRSRQVGQTKEKIAAANKELREAEEAKNRLTQNYDRIIWKYHWAEGDPASQKRLLDQEFRQLTEWRQWYARLKQLQVELKELSVRRAQREKELKEAQAYAEETRSAWRAWLQSQQFPGGHDDVSPEMVLDMMSVIDEARRTLQQISDAETEQNIHLSTVNEFIKNYVAVVRSIGVHLPEDDPQTGVPQLVGMLEKAEAEATKREELSQRLEEIADDIRKQTYRLEEQRQAIAELLAWGGADDRETFRRRGDLYEERRKLLADKQKLSQLFRRLVETDAYLSTLDSDTDERVQLLLRAWSETSRLACEERLKQLQVQLETSRQRIKTLQDEQVGIKAKLEQLADGEEYSQSRYRLQQLITDLEQSAKKWAVIELANHFIATAVADYEQKKQPRVLQRASHYFSKMTKGHYRRVLSPIHQETVEVERHDGHRLEPAFLSRGTVEQLYLAIRFALIEQYRDQARLPIVLDDILVNFDEERALATIHTLCEIARQQQILFFTCHSYLLELFRQVYESYHLIELTRDIQPVIQ